MTLHRFRAAILFACLGVAACSKTVATCDCLPAASVTLVNARAAQGTVDLLVDDEAVVSGVAAGASSIATFAPSGERRVRIRSGTTVLADFTTMLEPARLTALVITEDGADAFTVPLDTGHTARADRANVRIVSAGSGAAGTLLDVWFNAAAEPTLSLDPSVYGFGPYQYFSPGEVRVRFTPYSGTTVLAEATIQAAVGKTYAVVLKRDDAGGYSASVVTDP